MHSFIHALLSLQRKLLMMWTRVSTVPTELDFLGLSEKPVFYILEDRSLSNLLVLEQVCEEKGLARPTAPFVQDQFSLPHSVSALRRWQGFWRRRPSHVSYSRTLRQLLDHVSSMPEADVQLVPVAVFWGRRPDKDHGWFKLLFADHWAKVGRLRKFFIILAHGRNTWLQFSAPINAREIIDPGLSSKQNVRKLSRVLRVHFRQQRSATIGPELANRHAIVSQLLNMPSVRHAIQQAELKPRRALARARRYAYEISADLWYPFVLLMRRLLRRLWGKLYDGVTVHHAESLRRIAPGQTLVYLPCHRSHIDYLLLSYVLHDEGLAIPHIAAGINLNLPLIGPWLRRGGAFFLRRSFRDNPLYGAVMRGYLALNIGRGVPLEYFIEGTRSRTGRTLPAKLGMLDMTVRAFLQYPDRGLTLVPVYIGYEKLVEGRSYLAELSGQPKRKESLLGFFRSFKILRSEFGRVHLNFGEPIAVENWLDQHQPDWRSQNHTLTERPEWLPPVVDSLANKILTHMNAAADVNSVNLLATVLLASTNKAMDKQDLCAQIDIYRTLLHQVAESDWGTISADNGAAVIAYAEHLGLVKRVQQALGDIIIAEEEQAIALSYFANNTLHRFVIAGLLAACLRLRPRTEQGLQAAIKLIYPFVQCELFLPWTVEQLPDLIKRYLQALAEQELISQDGGVWQISGNPQRLQRLANCVTPMLERYYLTTVVLVQAGSGQLTQTDLIQRSQQLAQRLALLFGLRTPDYYDRSLFQTYLQTLYQVGLLHTDEQGQLCFDDDIVAPYRPLWQLLSPPVRHSIAQITGGAALCEE